MLSDPTQFVLKVFKKYLAPVSERFQEEFHKALPELPRAELMWRINFLAGIMTHLMSWSPVLSELTKGMCDLSDREAVVDRIIQFAAAGFRAPVGDAALMQLAAGLHKAAALERKG